MRPRVFPAEDGPQSREPRPGLLASMRPRVFPAEDAHGPSASGVAFRLL